LIFLQSRRGKNAISITCKAVTITDRLLSLNIIKWSN